VLVQIEAVSAHRPKEPTARLEATQLGRWQQQLDLVGRSLSSRLDGERSALDDAVDATRLVELERLVALDG